MVGVAVKVTIEPAQMEVDEAATETEGTTELVTVMVIGLETTVAGDAQLREEPIWQVTTSPLPRPVVE